MHASHPRVWRGLSLAVRFAATLALATLHASRAALAADATPGEFERVVRPFLKAHCVECHGEKEQQSRIRFDRLDGFVAADRHLWTLVHEQLASDAMPPDDRPRPTASERDAALRWIEREQRAAAVVGGRRLNRRETNAALQDVTGLKVDFAYSLPGDGKVDGFDTGAEGLQDSADAVSDALRVTRRAVDGLRFLEPSPETTYAADVRDAKDVRKVFDAWKSAGVTASTGDVVSRPGLGWLVKPKWLGDRGGLTIRVPPGDGRGLLRVEIDVSVQKFVEGLPNPHLWVELGGRDVAFEEIDAPPERPRTLVYEIPLDELIPDAKGIGVELVNRVEVPYAVPGFDNEEKKEEKGKEKPPGGYSLFRPAFDAKTTPLEQQPIPFVVLHRFSISVGRRAAWPPETWSVERFSIADDRASAARLLALWIERAWRRPVAEAERTRFLALFDKLRGQGESFDDALRATFQATLLAGSFRHLAAPSADRVEAQHAIASRLSFMLWGAPPDESLRAAAAEGKLLEPRVLDAQVDRLLADPRSDGFVRPFTTQWLELGQPITLVMQNLESQDHRFGRNLKASMQEESIAFFAQALADDRPASDLLSSDWTMMNDVLARHYGYEGVSGGRMRKVTLRPDDLRGGGLLGQAGVQSMLCWMGDNWVIYRGAWTLRRVLDDPPPPAPLEVPELIPSDSKNRGKTFKQLLKQHQEDAKCAVCHRAMDPLGFAFQNFDLSGRWRDVEHERYVKKELDGKIEWRGEGPTRPVDASGRLPRGEEFQSHEEFLRLMTRNYTRDVVRGLLKNWLLYGAGRKPDVDDLAEIDAIVASQESRGYPLRSLLRALVKSNAFLKK